MSAHVHPHVSAAPAVAFDRDLRRRRLRAVLALSAAVLLAELAGGILSHSLALVADAVHVFADIAGLTLAYAAMSLADRAPTRRHTFGLYRAEILAAFVNAQVLLVLGVGLLYESFRRVRAPVEIHTGLMFWVAAAAFAANVGAIALLSPGRHVNLNMRAAYLEVLTDAVGSLAVIGTSLAIPATGWKWLDPAVSAAVALWILPRAVALLRQTAHILLEGAPGEIDVGELRRQILGLPGVEALHDLHFWTLTSGLHSASVHVRAASDSERGEVLAAVQKLLQDEAGVDHATIQLEWGSEMSCHSSNREHA
jgi:cobalt-zinc-cadmium efflux system protein